jgi:hypothetical protein
MCMSAPDLSQIHLALATFLECSISSADSSTRAVEAFAIPEEIWLLPQFAIEEKRISYVVHVHCQGLCVDGHPTGVEGRFKVYLDFQIENLPEYLTTSETYKGSFPTREIMVMLGGVAYSTARGMILQKVLGTPLDGFSLPLRGPAELFQASIRRMQTSQEGNTESEKPKAKKSRDRKKQD